MKKILVYDLPTRVFHWIFAFLFIATFGIAKLIDSETVLFSVHMLMGMTISLAVILRIVWGFTGNKFARFSSFELKPSTLIEYFVSLVKSKTPLSLGHNPASSWAALAMMLFALGLGLTGFLMVNGYKEQLEDVHELISTLFIITAISHIAGIIIHTLRHHELIALSMITGKKNTTLTSATDEKQHPVVAIIFILIVAGFAFNLVTNFDQNTKTLKLFGSTLQLGESESSEMEKENSSHENDDD